MRTDSAKKNAPRAQFNNTTTIIQIPQSTLQKSFADTEFAEYLTQQIIRGKFTRDAA